MRRIAAGLVLASLAGCALGATGPRRGAPLTETPKCSTSRTGVVADGVFGAGFGIAGVGGLTNDESGLGVMSLIVGGLLLASAVHGNGNVSACQHTIVEHDEYVASLDAAPRGTGIELQPAAAPAAETVRGGPATTTAMAV